VWDWESKPLSPNKPEGDETIICERHLNELAKIFEKDRCNIFSGISEELYIRCE
jgi:hypothetical protein